MSTVAPYLAAADALLLGSTLPLFPPLAPTSFAQLIAIAQPLQYREPRRCWAIFAIAEKAARQQPDSQLSSEAAWWLAWGANSAFLPQEARRALERATQLEQNPFWAAAILWQRNAIPQITDDYANCVAQLARAYAGLQDSIWARSCQQTLAIAHILAQNFDHAASHLTDNLAYVVELERAMGLLIYSSLRRRQDRLREAHALATSARALFIEQSAEFGIARTDQFLAATYLRQERFQPARYHYQKALDWYQQANITLLEAMCHNGLAQVLNHLAEKETAAEHLAAAGNLFRTVGMRGAVADNLVDSGINATLTGDYRGAAEKHRAASLIYREIGERSGWVNARTLEAQCHIQLGNLQRALGLLESAENQTLEPKLHAQLARYFAIVWFYLNRPDLAEQFLNKAAAQYAGVDQPLSHCLTLIQTAILLLQQNRSAQSVLEQAGELVAQHDLTQQQPLVSYLHGEELIRQGNLRHGKLLLQQARKQLNRSDEIRCVLALASCQTIPADAINLCEQAFALARHYPALRWEICVARAQLSAERALRLTWLRHGLDALTEIRRTFSQPELVDSFWQQPQAIIDEAVQLALADGQIDLLHEFIEKGKTQPILRMQPVQAGTVQPEIDTQRREIEHLIAQLKHAPTDELATALTAAETRYASLIQKRGRLNQVTTSSPFTWQPCYDALTQHVTDWIALDYHLLPETVICLVATSNGERYAVQLPVPRFALRVVADNEPSERVLHQLGTLIPDSVWEQLTPETHLFIAPHRSLHAVPWAGVRHGAVPLVAYAIPVVVPSLQAARWLIERSKKPDPLDSLSEGVAGAKFDKRGVLLAVSQFGRGIRALPAVVRESAWLRGSADLYDLSPYKTWHEICEQREKLQSAGFWHIATHAFFDKKSGWNSGFALAQEDVLLDQMWDVAPLPPHLTFAACSGGQRLVLAGDVQIGLPLICLAAGAQSVVAHLRPILDAGAADLTMAYYRGYLHGLSPAAALAQAQRTAWEAGSVPHYWQQALCFGLP